MGVTIVRKADVDADTRIFGKELPEHQQIVDWNLAETAQQVRMRREQIDKETGETASGENRLIGLIPSHIFFANEAFMDDDFLKRWLEEHDDFRIGKGKL